MYSLKDTERHDGENTSSRVPSSVKMLDFWKHFACDMYNYKMINKELLFEMIVVKWVVLCIIAVYSVTPATSMTNKVEKAPMNCV